MGWTVLQKVFFAQFAIFQNLRQKPASDCFAAMNGNGGTPAVGMAQKIMAALGPYYFKTVFAQNTD